MAATRSTLADCNFGSASTQLNPVAELLGRFGSRIQMKRRERTLKTEAETLILRAGDESSVISQDCDEIFQRGTIDFALSPLFLYRKKYLH
jgi:hypothetical protein